MSRDLQRTVRPVYRGVVAAIILASCLCAGCQSSGGGSKLFSFNGGTKKASVPEAPPGYKGAGSPRGGKSSADPFLPTVKIPDDDGPLAANAK